jgi:hypothetical protein
VLTRAEYRFSDGIKDWLWKMGKERERWEDLEVFYVPQGMTNKPWDLNKEVFDHQFEVCIFKRVRREIWDEQSEPCSAFPVSLIASVFLLVQPRLTLPTCPNRK